MRGLVGWMRNYGATMFVVVGLAVVGVTVTQVQQEQRLSTKAAGEEEAKAVGVWFDPSPVIVGEDNRATVRLKLDALDQVMTHARLAFNYDPTKIEVEKVEHASVFENVDSQIGNGRLLLVSEGEFMGSGTWVKIDVKLLRPEPAGLVSDETLSSLRYQSGESVQVGVFDLVIGL